jgi:carbonic anhydrase
MRTLSHLFENNRRWADGLRARDPKFFERLAAQQAPELLWIGCSDSRVPANEIIGLLPGEVFVHRNVGNVVARGDLNGQSVLQFAVDVLKVRHVIVCGHYGCGGVRAALEDKKLGLVDGWIHHIRDVRARCSETSRLFFADLRSGHGGSVRWRRDRLGWRIRTRQVCGPAVQSRDARHSKEGQSEP